MIITVGLAMIHLGHCVILATEFAPDTLLAKLATALLTSAIPGMGIMVHTVARATEPLSEKGVCR